MGCKWKRIHTNFKQITGRKFREQIIFRVRLKVIFFPTKPFIWKKIVMRDIYNIHISSELKREQNRMWIHKLIPDEHASIMFTSTRTSPLQLGPLASHGPRASSASPGQPSASQPANQPAISINSQSPQTPGFFPVIPIFFQLYLTNPHNVSAL